MASPKKKSSRAKGTARGKGLPTSSGKPKKASREAVARAKKAVVEKQVATKPPLPPQAKVKTEAVAKRRVFTEDEDICICKAWVNISEDPVVGADQKKDQFWARIHQKMYQIYNKDVEVKVDDKKWPIHSIQDRFIKVEKDVKKFNVFYAQVAREHDKSGWTPEMIMEAATGLYLQHEGRPFKSQLCARILHKSPKYNPLSAQQLEDDPTRSGWTHTQKNMME